MRPRLALLLSLLPFLVAAGGQRFRNDAVKVRGFEAPLGWEPQPVSSYARLIAAWETRDGGRMTLVAQKVKAGTSARSLVDQSRLALERQKLRDLKVSPAPPAGDESDRVVLDATVDDGHLFMRQLYAVAGDMGYVLTMVGPIVRAPQMRHDFDEAAASLSVGDRGGASNLKR